MGKELEEALRNLTRRGVHTFSAVVVSVDKQNGTCVVSDDEIEFPDVRLSAVVDGNANKHYLFPAIGSEVLVSPIMEDIHKLYIDKYSEVESLDLKIGSVHFKIDAQGFLLKKQNETLKGLVEETLKAIQEMVFTVTTTGGSGQTTQLVNAATFSSIEQRFNQLLNDN